MNSPDHMLDRFEERLLAQLREVVAERAAETPARTVTAAAGSVEGSALGSAAPAARRMRLLRPRRRLVLVLGVALVLAVVAVIAGPALVGLQKSPAYAVVRDPDGSIRIYIRDYRDPKGLERRIESFGVRAAVDYIPQGMKCKEPRGDFVPLDETPRAMVSWGPFGDSGNYYWKLNPQYIKPDQTFVYVVQVSKDKSGDRTQRAAIRLANGPVAPCEPVPAS
jgi:hypothetical protein